MTEKRSSKRSRRWPRTGELHSEREPGFTRSGAGEPRRGWELGRRCPAQKIATLDVDATIIESWKREAKSLLRRRGELVERSFAHCYETGAMRRCHLRGQENILKRQLIHVGAFSDKSEAVL